MLGKGILEGDGSFKMLGSEGRRDVVDSKNAILSARLVPFDSVSLSGLEVVRERL